MVINSAQLSPPLLVVLDTYSQISTLQGGHRAQVLQQMIEANIPIPKTCVMTAVSIEQLFEHNRFLPTLSTWFSQINWQNQAAVNLLSQQIQERIAHFEFPEDLLHTLYQTYTDIFEGQFLAVRPSFMYVDNSSDHLSQLFVKGEANLAESILQVLAKAYLVDFLETRHKEWQSDQKIPATILIQQMIDARSSGLAFTAHPQTGDQHTIFISAGWGVSAVSLSEISQADTFEVDTHNWKISNCQTQVKKYQYTHQLDQLKQGAVPTNKQQQPSLTDQEVINLGKIVTQVSQTELSTQVIEWAVDSTPSAHMYVLNVFPYQKKSHSFQVVPEKLSPNQVYLSSYIKILEIGTDFIEGDDVIRQLPQHPQSLITHHQGDVIKKKIIATLQQAKSHKTQLPFFYRCQNLATTELMSLPEGKIHEKPEMNPALGFRGGLRMLRNYDLFNLETEAVAQVNQQFKDQVEVVVPFIRTSTEFALLKKHLLNQTYQATLSQHLWLECSVPANLLQIEEFLNQQPAGIIIDIGMIWALLFGIDLANRDIIVHYPFDEHLIYTILRRLHQSTQSTNIKVYLYLKSFHQRFIEFAAEFGFEGVIIETKNKMRTNQALQDFEKIKK